MQNVGWESADRCNRLRTRVEQIAPYNWREAYDLAATIPLVWYRVQALSYVAQHAPDTEVDVILQAAAEEAGRDADSYRQTAVLAWVIDSALARNRKGQAEDLLRQMMDRVAAITPLKSRASMLETLLKRAVRLNKPSMTLVANSLLDTAASLQSDPVSRWRSWGRSYVNRTTWILSRADLPLAAELLSQRFGEEQARALLARHGPDTVAPQAMP
jgi:hypothetical protein